MQISGKQSKHIADTSYAYDHALVDRFIRYGNEQDFRELYRKFAPRLNQLISRLLGSADPCVQDVIQTTWIRAIENLAQFAWKSTLKTWLTGVAINCTREHIRMNARCSRCDWFDHLGHSTVQGLNQTINRIDLEQAISELPDGYREVLVLHDVEGYTHVEIGRFLQIEAGTSKSQLSRARAALRHRLTRTDAYEQTR